MSMSSPEVHVASPPQAVAEAAGAEVLAVVGRAVAGRGRAAVALAGGTTPGRLYSYLAAAGTAGAPWDRVDFFFGDERCVPPTSPESNYALARRELLEPLRIPAQSVHRIEAELRPPAAAAEQYERRLRTHFGGHTTEFDLVLLGVGADGHTASLFPGDDALEVACRWVVPVRAPAGYQPTERITLTLPVLNQARTVIVLAWGDEKRRVIAAVLSGDEQAQRLPIARVRPTGRLAWYLDDAAAGRDRP
jgi:6-phosphogluconolactonase